MRIGIDARELCGKPTGVGRHLAGLLGAWSTDAAASRHTFVLYAHQAIAAPLRNAEVARGAGSGRHAVGTDGAAESRADTIASTCSSRRVTPRPSPGRRRPSSSFTTSRLSRTRNGFAGKKAFAAG